MTRHQLYIGNDGPAIPVRSQVAPDAPLRLGAVAALAFLRRHGDCRVCGGRQARGRLMIGLQEGNRQRDRGCLCLRGERICDNGRQKQGGED